MTPNVKDPPLWIDGMSYEEFKKEVEVWQLLKAATDIEEGPFIFRILPLNAKNAVQKLTPAEIGSKDGLKKILDILDIAYLAEKNQRIFIDLEAFEKFKRPSTMSMSTFLLEFEALQRKVEQHECKYPDGVLAYKVLQAANLSSEHEKLCKATITTGNWSYKAIVDQIKKIFSDITPNTSRVADKPIKVESTYYTRKSSSRRNSSYYDTEGDGENSDEDFNTRSDRSSDADENDVYYGKYNGSYYNRRKSYQRPNQSPRQNPNQSADFQRGNYQRGNSQNYHQGRRYVDVDIRKLSDSYDKSPNVPNPKDNRGNYTSCRKCRSIYHWMADCPHTEGKESETSGSKIFYTDDRTGEVYMSFPN